MRLGAGRRPWVAPALWVALALWAAGCTAPPSPPPVDTPRALAGVGAPCGVAEPCEAWLVCVDGACAERLWSTPGQGTPTLAPGALDVPGGGGRPEVDATDAADADPASEDRDAVDSSAPDADAVEVEAVVDGASPELDAPVPPDTVDAGHADGGDPGPEDAGPEAEVISDVVAGDAAEGDADADADAAPPDAVEPPPVPETVVLLISEDDPATAPGVNTILLDEGQAWVAGLTLDKPGQMIGVQVRLGDAFGTGSCGRFRPAVWLPNASGVYWPEPSWVLPVALPMTSSAGNQVFLLEQPAPLAGGKFRLGLIFEGPCEGSPPTPVLISDSSGDTSRSWLWAPEAEGPPWVPAGAFGVQGRWILRALVEVQWTFGP